MIDEKILNHPLFDAQAKEESGLYETIEQRLTEAGVQYPDFAPFEAPKETHVISWDSERDEFTATGLDGTWERIEHVYDHIQSLGRRHEADFDESALTSPEVDSALGKDMVFLKSHKSHSRLLIGPVNHRNIAFYHYYGFLRTAKAYIAEPSNFLLAYSFLENHPAFWTRHDPEKYPYDWATSSGLSSLWVSPMVDDEGNTVIAMEHGSSVPPEYKTRYHDTALDVWAPTFEEAYIKLAAKLHKYFYLDGTKREDVPYIPQAWEVEVADRLAKHDAEMKAND